MEPLHLVGLQLNLGVPGPAFGAWDATDQRGHPEEAEADNKRMAEEAAEKRLLEGKKRQGTTLVAP